MIRIERFERSANFLCCGARDDRIFRSRVRIDDVAVFDIAAHNRSRSLPQQRVASVSNDLQKPGAKILPAARCCVPMRAKRRFLKRILGVGIVAEQPAREVIGRTQVWLKFGEIIVSVAADQDSS